MCEEFSTVPDTHCKSLISVSCLKICCFSERIISASKELKGIDESHSFILNSFSCFEKVSSYEFMIGGEMLYDNR